MTACSTASWEVFGTTATVATRDPRALAGAAAVVRDILDEVDVACSRFREDSELAALNRAGGAPVTVSMLFLRALRCALRGAELSDGLLDPTVGRSLRAVGYDRDFAAIRNGGRVRFTRAAGWRCIELDSAHSTVRVPAGVELDFGATAKALAADIAAAAAGAAIEGGVLVSIGGDLAVSGAAPLDGWPVRVTDDHRAAPGAVGQTVVVRGGGLATSSTTQRRWRAATQELHHIIDPRTGAPVAEHWRTISVTAESCVDANIASTTAIIRGEQAPAWLTAVGLPARLVAGDGTVTVVGGWPAQPSGART